MTTMGYADSRKAGESKPGADYPAGTVTTVSELAGAW
jgi:hypothetical protein